MAKKIRQIRSDATLNRERLVVAATRAFAKSSVEPSMREIARQAGVGVGTLYRHFPTRASLVEAVYHDQVERLTQGAHELLAKHAPAVALRQWMNLFAGWIATKQGMLGTLQAMVRTGEMEHAQGRGAMLKALGDILNAGRSARDIRHDANADDVAVSLVGFLTVAGTTEKRAQLARLLDLLMDGLRPSRPTNSYSRPSRSA